MSIRLGAAAFAWLIAAQCVAAPWGKQPEKKPASPSGRPTQSSVWPFKFTGKSQNNQGFTDAYAKARSLERSGKLTEARVLYQALVSQFPDRFESIHRLAVLTDKERRHREAQVMYTEALRLSPRNADIFSDLGYCFYLQGQLDKAASALTKALMLEPTNARASNNLGLVYGQQQNYTKALDAFRMAGSEAGAQYNLAFVLASQEKFDAAKACFNRALEADPTFDDARDALASFERVEQDPEGVWDNSETIKNGVRYVPYSEEPNSSGSSSSSQSGGRNLGSLQQQVRTMLQSRGDSAGGSQTEGPSQ